MKMKSRVQHTNVAGMRRKVDLESEAKLTKVKNVSGKNKMPLKGELLIQMEEVQDKYTALEDKFKRDIEMLESENSALKDTNKKMRLAH